MQEAWLSIGGVRICVRAEREMVEGLLTRCGAYQVPAGDPELVLDVHAVPGFAPASPVKATFPAADAAYDGTRYRFVRRDLEAELVPGSSSLAVCRCQDQPILVENTLRLCLSTMIPLRGGLMLHASALERDGAGFLFAGISGSGKSTTLKMLADDPRVRSLGDEVTVVRMLDENPQVESTPFGGELAPVPPGKAPLRRLFFLNRSPGALDSVVGRSARLLRNALAHAPSPAVAEALLANAETLVALVECRELVHPTREELQSALAT